MEFLEKAARDLRAAGAGNTLVVSGSNNPAVQAIVAGINQQLGNYGSTIAGASNLRQGDDAAMNTFIDDVKAGRVDAVIFYGANPVYNHPRGRELAAALPKVATSVSFAERADETASLCRHIAPDCHFLESWGDAEPVPGVVSLIQPTINKLFDTRQAQASLLTWAGQPADYQAYISRNFTGGADNWNQALYTGIYGEPAVGGIQPTATAATALGQIRNGGNALEFVPYEKVGMGSGSQANNPWFCLLYTSPSPRD